MGFRKRRSTINTVFALQQLIEKHREYNLSTYIAFVDFEKAFERVSREKLWEIMSLRGHPPNLITSIQSLYHKTKLFISLDENISNSVMTNIGVKQGCSLLPTLFDIYIDDIIRNWKELQTDLFKYLDKDTILNVILYADDLTLIGKKEEEFAKLIIQTATN